jgi:Family of unknown function (DUF5946)
METIQVCPECGTTWHNGETCQDYFYQMLFWEAENPNYGVVHHLMVLCYHLQHPSLYSPQGLREGIKLLRDFLECGLTPDQVRKRNQSVLNSSTRTWKITGTLTSHGTYDHPIAWTMTASDVIEKGKDDYCDSVQAWARSVHEALEAI